jgi:hypothetical protein
MGAYMQKIFLGVFILLIFISCFSENRDSHGDKTIGRMEKNDIFHSGKNIYETEEEYLNAYYDFNYFEYRDAMLYRCLVKNDFTYFETDILDNDHLVGNQIDNDYMEIIKEVIHIRNNLSFGNKEIDDYFISQYNYYNPERPKGLSPQEKNILLQINSLLNPKEEKMEIEELIDVVLGVWQKDSYSIYAGYLDTIRFSDDIMAVAVNEMNHSKRFYKIEGEYEIINNNIIMKPGSYEYIKGGKYIFANNDGLIQDYIGEEMEGIVLSPNGIISYPIVSLSKIYNEFEGKNYYKLILFVDRPLIYYKVSEAWE